MDSTLKARLLIILEWFSRLIVAGVFVFAAIPKMLDPMAFSKAIVNYRFVMPIIGQDYVFPVAMFMPPLEAIGGIALLFNRWKRVGSLICGGLLILFIVLVAQALIRGFNIDCGCFGTGAVGRALAEKVGIEKIVENTIWLAMCVFVWARGKKG